MTYQSVFVGREEEQEILKKLLAKTIGGDGTLALVTGPAGMGKTVLVENFFLRNDGVRLLQARCGEDDQPYEVILKLLRKYMELDSHQLYGGEEDVHQSVIAECKDIEKLLISPDKSTGVTGQQMLFSSVRNILASIAKSTILAVFVDNLQTADGSSMEFVLSLVNNMDDCPFMFIAAYREEELPDDHPLRSISIVGDNIQQIFLEPLSALDVLEMVEQMLGVKDMPTLFIKRLYKETAGNPLFTREIIRAILEDTAIDRSEPYWYTKVDLSAMHLPSNLKEIVISRVKRLDPNSKLVLQYGAAVGQSFSGAMIEKAMHQLGTPASKTRSILSSLSDSKLLRLEEGLLKFEYPELRDLLYSEIENKEEVHKLLAKTMEEEEVDVYSIAKQYSLAGVDEKAWKYEEKAGDQALLAMAPLEAEKHFSRAKEALERCMAKKRGRSKDEGHIRLFLKHGDASHSLGEVDSALEDYDKAMAMAKGAKNDVIMAEVHGKKGDAYRTRSQWSKAKKEYESSLDIGKLKEDKHIMAHSLRGLGYLDWRKGQFDNAIARYSDALKYAEETKDITLVGIILIEFGNVYNEKGELDKALRYYLKSVDILTKSRDFSELARAYNNIGDTYLQMGQWNNAVAFFKKTGAVAEKIGNKSMMGWALFNAAEALAKGGDPDKALNYADGSLRILEKIGDSIGLSGVYKGYGLAYRMKEDWEQAEESFNKSREFGENANSPYTLGEIYLETGAFFRDKGDLEKAEECLKKAEDIGKDIGAKVLLERIERERKRDA